MSNRVTGTVTGIAVRVATVRLDSGEDVLCEDTDGLEVGDRVELEATCACGECVDQKELN